MNGKSRVAIDIFVGNLFERTADVGLLAVYDPLCAQAALSLADPAREAAA